MSSFAVIRDVRKALKLLIEGEWKENNPEKPLISFEAPHIIKRDESTTNTLSLYLVQVIENSFLKNAQADVISDQNIRPAPLVLNLLFLVTPIGNSSANEKLILGKVMQIFHDYPVIPNQYFDGTCIGSREEIKILLHPFSLDDLIKIWNAFQDAPYRLSIGYMVSPVLIDSTKKNVSPGESLKRIC